MMLIVVTNVLPARTAHTLRLDQSKVCNGSIVPCLYTVYCTYFQSIHLRRRKLCIFSILCILLIITSIIRTIFVIDLSYINSVFSFSPQSSFEVYF